MDAERYDIKLMEETYAYAGRASDEENAEEFKTQIKKYISILKEVIESDFDKLDDKALYELLTKIYDIRIDEKDYLNILSKYNNKKYTRFCTLPTSITFYDTKTEGRGTNHFDFWEQLYQVCYVVAISDDFKYDYNKTYSKEEIKKFITDKSIIILKEKSRDIDDSLCPVKEEYEVIPSLRIDIYDYGHNKFILNNLNLLGDILREKFTKKKVLKDVRKTINDLNDEMKSIFDDTQLNDYYYSGIAKVCKEWYGSSEEKAEYEELQKQVKKLQRKLYNSQK